MTTISAAHAEELHEVEEGKVGPWTYVTDQKTGSGRWREHHTMVIADEQGQHWGVEYAVGLTEMQDHEYPRQVEDDDHQIPLTRLYPHTVTAIEYKTKSAEEAA